MTTRYDFARGKRGTVIRSTGKKTRITIRIDDDLLQWFRTQVDKAGGGNYQTLINEALRAFVESKTGHTEELIRRVLREELGTYVAKKGK